MMNTPTRNRLVVVMDPIESINPVKDSTLAILVAAQARGWELFYAEMHDLWLRDGIAWGRLSPLQVFDDLHTWFERGAQGPIDRCYQHGTNVDTMLLV